jgi:hypothetical protein
VGKFFANLAAILQMVVWVIALLLLVPLAVAFLDAFARFAGS